ncbi:MAG TPA: hypothetical protein VFF30_11630 [Nitrososphaerales archaeon]|nr:hypothetical protein [Nitrososphaerales archaeon]
MVLLDFRLGDMTGDLVARKIREMKPMGLKTKFVLIAAFEFDEGVVSKLKEAMAIEGKLDKPFGLLDLEKTITETLLP